MLCRAMLAVRYAMCGKNLLTVVLSEVRRTLRMTVEAALGSIILQLLHAIHITM
jgi:hypothetical protein